eukprot:Protomagalhaensia_wolfi_Nauph_80__2585@NODE_2733_length_1002_cov_246_714434_g2141_i0_p1_GENE_NODE_2733_length_1002_cov_246_714434_g2141_i0NODE_2733_length_1002_cov_246_714434_g2141_i0_p1_ORF_typecomplete_len267_score28_03Torus/PF16131_5/2_8e09zf_CCCH_4/PF18345_1/4e08zfCCCH_3/PF15663_5/1_8e04zfCCCH_3/PF15663_5/4_4e06zfCCCH/PF00642_24/1_7e05zfCCCH_4/PF18044_1/8_4e05zfCCCH_2/PF14608_6/0_0075_NODE_2733_length_1002_cov_246_714434_g2141_i061801
MSRPNGTARSFKLEGWEKSDFPIVCETCLGSDPAIRMVKAACDKECKICARPCTVFRWQPGREARHKGTIICQACARSKNVCQVCLFDLQYGLPVQVRDRFLEAVGDGTNSLTAGETETSAPLSRVNRDYQVNRQQNLPSQTTAAGFDRPTHPILQRLQRTQPYYRRNVARVCTFWLRGQCARGDTCPFRHEKDGHDPSLSNQKIKDRYYGHNDPVANKILKRFEEQPPQPESDNDQQAKPTADTE